MNEHYEVNDALDKCSHLALSQLLPDKNLILMTDASFQAADYEVLNPIENVPQHAKPMLQWHTPPKHLLPHKKRSMYAEETLATYWAFKEFGDKI